MVQPASDSGEAIEASLFRGGTSKSQDREVGEGLRFLAAMRRAAGAASVSATEGDAERVLDLLRSWYVLASRHDGR
jgi:hypothetical protein